MERLALQSSDWPGCPTSSPSSLRNSRQSSWLGKAKIRVMFSTGRAGRYLHEEEGKAQYLVLDMMQECAMEQLIYIFVV